MRRDACDTHLEQQLDAGAEGREILVRERAHLEASGIIVPREVVVHETIEVSRPLHRHPADLSGLELLCELAPDVGETRSPRRQKPLLSAAGEDVDLARVHVERARADPLNGVDDEINAALAAGAPDALEVDGVVARERY